MGPSQPDADFLPGLRQLGEALGQSADTSSMAELASTAAMRLLGADRVDLYLWDEDTGCLRSCTGDSTRRMGADTAGVAMQTGAPVVVPAYGSWVAAHGDALADGVVTSMAAPLPAEGGRPLGAIQIDRLTGAGFTPDDASRLELLVSLVAPRLELERLGAGDRDVQSRIDLAVEHSPHLASGFLDTNWVIRSAEGGAFRQTGLPISYFRGRSAREVYRQSPDVLEAAGRALGGAATSTTWRSSLTGWSYETTFTPLHTEEGRVRGAFFFVLGLNDRHEAATARLESEAKARFLATMSHELRTPLNAILGFSQLLGNGDLDADCRRFLDNIIASGRELLILVDDVLDRSRIRSGQVKLETEVVAVGDVLRAAAHTATKGAASKQVRLTVQPSSSLTVAADRRRLGQVVDCLVANAIELTVPGGHVSLGAKTGLNGWMEINVRAPDVPHDDHCRVEEAVYAAGEAPVQVPRAGDLNLTLSRRLVDLMGGGLTISRTPYEGSTFTVLLPAEGPTTLG